MLSRAASSIYWMSRYLERADNVARFIDVNVRLILDMGLSRQEAQWEPLVYASGDEEDFSKRYQSHDEKSVIEFLTFDVKNPNSIISCVKNARENARTVCEIISSEMWQTINALYHLVEQHSRKRKIDNLQIFFKEVLQTSERFAGQIENTMSHGEGWHFARVGKLLERADKTARMLDMKYFILLPSGEHVDSPVDTVEWAEVLKSVSAFEMYSKQFHRANYRDVTNFLIFDKNFPRSIRFSINAATQSLSYISDILDIKAVATDEITALHQSLDMADIDTVLNGGLHEFIDMLQIKLNMIDRAIHKSFFDFER